MKKKIKTLSYVALLILFFIWGVFTVQNQIFPYKILSTLKIKTYDKIFKSIRYSHPFDQLTSDARIYFKDYYNKYPNFMYKDVYLTKYYRKAEIWYDRSYHNHENDEKLLDFYLVKNRRHSDKIIEIKLMQDVEIYRAICKLNNNSVYKDWIELDFEVAIIGRSCVHNKLVKKKFKKGFVKMNSGGPISSDPIFIKGPLNIKNIIIN
jgi:hypothetical protein